jgi:serine/threonine-protein kinase RsbW
VPIAIHLRLPREAISVAVCRQVIRHALTVLGVTDQVREDVELALSEACGNAVRHAHDSAEYDVRASIDEERCVVDVVDGGDNTVPPPAGATTADTLAENGRGLHVIRALAENVRVQLNPLRGLAVHFEKPLVRRAGSPALHGVA